MNKKSFVELVKNTGEFKNNAEAERAVEAVFGSITKALIVDKNLSIKNFGTFSSVLQKGKTGTVPGTDKTYTTTDKMTPKFKAAAKFKEDIALGKV